MFACYVSLLRAQKFVVVDGIFFFLVGNVPHHLTATEELNYSSNGASLV